jgi:hypothetical protein
MIFFARCFPDLPSGNCWPRERGGLFRGCWPTSVRQPVWLNRPPSSKGLKPAGAQQPSARATPGGVAADKESYVCEKATRSPAA